MLFKPYAVEREMQLTYLCIIMYLLFIYLYHYYVLCIYLEAYMRENEGGNAGWEHEQ